MASSKKPGSTTRMGGREALALARERRDGDELIIYLADGRKAKIRPITPSLIEAVTSKIKQPIIPIYHNEDKNEDYENPNDPKYLQELAEANRQRGVAAMDAMVLFGVELVDGVPEDDKWIEQIKWLERQGTLDLSGYNLDDDLDREFLYKRFVAVDTTVLGALDAISGVQATEEETRAAEDSFPSN